MPDTTVKYFASSMSGAPSLSGQAGKLIEVLDACLIDGFGSVTLDSLVVSGDVATATKSAGHNFAMVGNAGPVISIAGATPSALNGQWRVTITSDTQFTFATSGISNQTATGTITAKRAPLGFSKAFSGTNKAAYRADALASTRLYLRLDDTGTYDATFTMYEAMTGIDTGTGASSSVYIRKSNAADATARSWRLYGDDRAFYFFVNENNSTNWAAMFFGDTLSYRSGDAYCAALLGGPSGSPWISALMYVDGTTSDAYLSRSYTQIGSAIAASRYSHRKHQYIGDTNMPDPNPVSNGRHFWPVEIWEGTTYARGLMPGLYCPLHSVADGSVTNDVPAISNGTVLVQKIFDGNYRCAFAIDRAWREP